MLIVLKPKCYFNPELVSSVHEAEHPDGSYVVVTMITGATYNIDDKTVEETYQLINKNSKVR